MIATKYKTIHNVDKRVTRSIFLKKLKVSCSPINNNFECFWSLFYWGDILQLSKGCVVLFDAGRVPTWFTPLAPAMTETNPGREPLPGRPLQPPLESFLPILGPPLSLPLLVRIFCCNHKKNEFKLLKRKKQNLFDQTNRKKLLFQEMHVSTFMKFINCYAFNAL